MHSARSWIPRVLALLGALGSAASASPESAPSLHELQPPEVRAEIERSGMFRTLYRTIQDTEDHALERLGIRMLFGDPDAGIDSDRVRRRTAELGGGPGARREALREVAEWLEAETARPDFATRHLTYQAEERPDQDFLVYTAPSPHVVHWYGEVLFEFRPVRPRGGWLQGWTDAVTARRRANLREWFSTQNWNPFNYREYVIPSHIGSEDLARVRIRRRMPRPWPGARFRQPGGPLRDYVRVREGGFPRIEVRSPAGRPRGTLVLQGDPTPPRPRGHPGRPLHPRLARWLESIRVQGRAVRYLPPR